MANTIIQLRRTSTAGNVPNPDMMTSGELILNYADGNLFFLASNSSVQRIGGTSAPGFGVVSANSISLVSATADDTLTLIPGNGIAIKATTSNNVVQFWNNMEEHISFALSSEKSTFSAGTANLSFRWGMPVTLTRPPRAFLSTSGTGPTFIDVNNMAGTSIFSANLSIDTGANTSVGASVPCVLSTTSFADDELCTIDIDAVATNSKGLKITFYYRRTE